MSNFLFQGLLVEINVQLISKHFLCTFGTGYGLGHIRFICALMRSAKNNGEGVCTNTYKLALLQLVETEKKTFHKEIMRG